MTVCQIHDGFYDLLECVCYVFFFSGHNIFVRKNGHKFACVCSEKRHKIAFCPKNLTYRFVCVLQRLTISDIIQNFEFCSLIFKSSDGTIIIITILLQLWSRNRLKIGFATQRK